MTAVQKRWAPGGHGTGAEGVAAVTLWTGTWQSWARLRGKGTGGIAERRGQRLTGAGLRGPFIVFWEAKGRGIVEGTV